MSWTFEGDLRSSGMASGPEIVEAKVHSGRASDSSAASRTICEGEVRSSSFSLLAVDIRRM